MIFVGNVRDLQELQKWTCKNVTTKESCCKLKVHLCITLTNAIIGVIFGSYLCQNLVVNFWCWVNVFANEVNSAKIGKMYIPSELK